jgi:hypothetical protein
MVSDLKGFRSGSMNATLMVASLLNIATKK